MKITQARDVWLPFSPSGLRLMLGTRRRKTYRNQSLRLVRTSRTVCRKDDQGPWGFGRRPTHRRNIARLRCESVSRIHAHHRGISRSDKARTRFPARSRRILQEAGRRPSLPGANPIDATYEGRFDAAFAWRDHKWIKLGQGNGSQEGYGKGHEYDGRIVLHQVSDVWAEPLPRSETLAT